MIFNKKEVFEWVSAEIGSKNRKETLVETLIGPFFTGQKRELIKGKGDKRTSPEAAVQ